MKEQKPLEPPDRERCQAEVHVTKNNTWQMGGRPEKTVERCDKKPAFVLSERTPGKDGRCGSMSLCLECIKLFADKYVPPGKSLFDDYNMEPLQ